MSNVIVFPPNKEHNELLDKADLLKGIIDILVKNDIDIHLVVDSDDKALEEIVGKLPLAQAGNKLYPKVTFTTNIEKADKLITRSFWAKL